MTPARVLVLSGPMHDQPDRAAFDNAAFALRAIGFEVQSPTEANAPTCGTWRGWMRIFADQVCTADALVLLPGWGRSQEAKVLREFAAGLGLRVWPLHLAMRQKPEEKE
jgi:hypothetical protein